MSVILEIRRRGRHVVGSIFGALLFAYFLFHAVQGDRGILAWVQVRQQIVDAEAQLARTDAERKAWESRVALLRSAGLDRDMLDERARLVTGLTRPDEIVILEPAAGRTGR